MKLKKRRYCVYDLKSYIELKVMTTIDNKAHLQSLLNWEMRIHCVIASSSNSEEKERSHWCNTTENFCNV